MIRSQTSSSAINPSVISRYFGTFAEFSRPENTVLEKTIAAARSHPAGARLHASGEYYDKPRVVLSGWACSAITFADGKRQILDFYLPGDLIGFCSRPGARAHASCFALTPVTTAAVNGLVSPSQQQPAEFPGLVKACIAIEEQQERSRIMHIVRLGHQLALERMASLLVDLYRRLSRCGLTMGAIFDLPVTQEVIGDALGLSTVHVNRTLQDLRRQALIRTMPGQVEILNLEVLATIAGIDSWETV